MVLLQPQAEKDPNAIVQTIQTYNISMLHFVPSMLGIFVGPSQHSQIKENCQSLTHVVTSGEALGTDVSITLQELISHVKIVNYYGPTEATVDVSVHIFDLEKDRKSPAVPIGVPIPNVKLFILDKNLNHVPVGVVGELYLCSEQLARGYLGRPELTADRFIPNPFNYEKLSCYQRMYKSGDLTKFRSDGVIEYLGRIDNQVKLRGFRIELGEIDAACKSHYAVQDCVTLIQQLVGDTKQLTAYLILKPMKTDAQKPTKETLQVFF